MTEPGPESPQLRTWRALRHEVEQRRPVVLVVVAAHQGSSPGRTGWLMAVGRSGWIAGTTGGGPAENQVIAEAVALITASDRSPRLLTQTHRRGAESDSGLLCGGEQVLALVVLGGAALPALRALDAALTAGDTFEWTISDAGWSPGRDSRVGGSWSYPQTSGPSHRVVLVGAGHVGAALAPLLVSIGFRVTVVDERPGAAARLADHAHDVLERRYEELGAVVPAGDRTCVVIAAHAPERDAAAVSALGGVRLGYLGVLGSRAKLAHLPEQSWLEVPMGLAIGSHTPAEIAVSVAARLVGLRAGIPWVGSDQSGPNSG